MRRLLFLMPILLCAAVSAHAQSLDAFKQRLAEPTPGATLFNRAQVTVTEHDDAARAVADAARDGRLLSVEKDTEKRFSGQRSWEFDVERQGWRYHMSNIMAVSFHLR